MTFNHIVKFHEYCPNCVHWEKSESEDPCWECLDNPENGESRAPVHFEERKKVAPSTGRKN